MPLKPNAAGAKPDIHWVAGLLAAHATMQRILGLEATRLRISEGRGACRRPRGRIDPHAMLLLSVAGYAWESGCGRVPVDLDANRDLALVLAAALLEGLGGLRVRVPPVALTDRGPLPAAAPASGKPGFAALEAGLKAALAGYFREACRILRPRSGMVEALAGRLLAERTMPAEEVDAFFNAWRERRLAALQHSTRKPDAATARDTEPVHRPPSSVT